jgi:hypothetical protein
MRARCLTMNNLGRFVARYNEGLSACRVAKSEEVGLGLALWKSVRRLVFRHSCEHAFVGASSARRFSRVLR